MKDYTLTCSSTVDLPLNHLIKREIPYVPFHFILDGRDYLDDMGQTISNEDFFKRISAGAMPSTSQVNVGEFLDFFEPLLKEGQDILHIAFSSGLSGTYQSAVLAKEQLKEEYPERTIEVVDSLGASSGYGLLVDLAADMKEGGASLLDVRNMVEDTKLNIHHWFFSTDLSHYKRGGRISATSAYVGGLLNIAPLMNINTEGKLIPRKKIRGKKQVIKEMVQMMEEHAKDGTNYTGKCFLSHSAVPDDARKVADIIEERFPHLDGKVMINNVGTVIGAHTGPGTVALFFEGDKRID